ncbi:TetR family transcriptional regulator [Gordonia insulae]|uniref:HTH tetR-type domain-containing protein n=1 Tax=Gordonia insulae TaxID=2420509 RepID=A0A3G8JPQ4_9ACTN|nr:TetR family transcriptional regulator [Gordonia insulae]AZG46140.1 hypothetical protein D7316_02741 [Gordonia insulae]
MPSSPSTRATSTRAALLAAAESLFLADGFDQVSVRAICAAANANPAAVHYHFGSKDRLAVELIEDRLGPLWADPLDRFDPDAFDIRARPDAREPRLDGVAELVGLVLAPFVDIQEDPVGRLHLRLLSRFVLSHPQATWTRPWFQLDRWSRVLSRLVDDLPEADARRRWGLAFQLILTQFGNEPPLSGAAVTALADFVVAGLCAPIRPAAPQENR